LRNSSNLQPINTLHCNTSTLNASMFKCFNASMLQCFDTAMVQCFLSSMFKPSMLQHFNAQKPQHSNALMLQFSTRQPTFQPFNPSTLKTPQPFNTSTHQLFNASALKSFNGSTCLLITVYFITSKLQLRYLVSVVTYPYKIVALKRKEWTMDHEQEGEKGVGGRHVFIFIFPEQ